MAPPRVLEILERLTRQPTTSFHEEGVAREAASIGREMGASVRRDAFGNLVAAPPGRRAGPPIWLVAHMDHPGVEVLGPGEGRLLGGIAPAYLRKGVRLRFYRDGDRTPATLARFTESTRRFRFTGPPEVRRLRRGDFGVFELTDFRAAGDRVHARQLDDLAGCAVSLAVVERACRNPSLNVRALLTRAEEMGFVGTLAAISEGLLPRGAWVVSVEASRAIPGVSIGGGPVIRVGDRARTFDHRAEDLLAVGQARLPRGRPVQRALMSGGTCEATPWMLWGYKATGLAIPLGNYHNMGAGDRLRPETVAVRDLATAVDLLESAARNVPRALRRDEEFRRRLSRYLRRHGRTLLRTRA